MRLLDLVFIVAVTIWLFIPLAYFMLIRFTIDVQLTARNKVSRGGSRKSC